MMTVRKWLIVVAMVPIAICVLGLAAYGVLNLFWGIEPAGNNRLIRCNPDIERCPEMPRRQWPATQEYQVADGGRSTSD
jgi:hypothetical protein